jgi:hypothetical protein
LLGIADGGKRQYQMKKKHAILSLRLPPDLHQHLADSASARYPRNSLNAEIVQRLRRSLSDELQFINSDSEELDDIRRRLAEVERALFGEGQTGSGGNRR